MSQNLQKSATNLVSVPTDFPKTRVFFDWLEYVFNRIDGLSARAKILAVSLFLLVLALVELYKFIHGILSG